MLDTATVFEYCCTLFFMQHALLSVTLEPGGVSAEERMTVVISMVMMENAYKHVIIREITSPA